MKIIKNKVFDSTAEVLSNNDLIPEQAAAPIKGQDAAIKLDIS